MSEHTDGPWERSDFFPNGCVHNGRLGKEHVQIAEIRSDNPADARLISTAPELLWAAVETLPHINHQPGCQVRGAPELRCDCGADTARKRMQHIIAKARGEEVPS